LKDECYVYLYYILAGSDSYLTLLWLVPWRLKDESYVYLYNILLDQTVT
jgi:hypothetical protein